MGKRMIGQAHWPQGEPHVRMCGQGKPIDCSEAMGGHVDGANTPISVGPQWNLGLEKARWL